jgi:putative phosphoribosyl transferase
MLFADRHAAGEELAKTLRALSLDDPIIAALPRGGVPVARPVADALAAPLMVLMVRKLGVPGHEEFAFGALGEDGTMVTNPETVRRAQLTPEMIESVRRREHGELERRAGIYRISEPIDVRDRTVVIVDDGMATGSTMQAAVDVARHRGARRIIVAVPVAAHEAAASLAKSAEVVVLDTPADFGSVGSFYRIFTQVSDAEVLAALTQA